MSTWDDYPSDYRSAEVQHIVRALCAGESVALIGLSGSGKSNLVKFLAGLSANPSAFPLHCPRPLAVDCNRLPAAALPVTPAAVFNFLRRALEKLLPPGEPIPASLSTDAEALDALEVVVERCLDQGRGLALLLDRFDALFDLPTFPVLAGNLRALRDAHKYRLVYVTAARRPLDSTTELAELFFGHTLWLGPLSPSDARWSARRDAHRLGANGLEWPAEVLDQLICLSGGYPSFLRAACEAYAAGAGLSDRALRDHPAVARRVAEFWSDRPDSEMVRLSGLQGHPWLAAAPPLPPAGEARLTAAVAEAPPADPRLPALLKPAVTVSRPGESAAVPQFDTTRLTAKEHLLLTYLQAHPGQVCEKDDLVRAIWPEDVLFAEGVRDESLAQLVRRLRVKIEPDPASPRYIHTVAGRGYLFRP